MSILNMKGFLITLKIQNVKGVLNMQNSYIVHIIAMITYMI